jgi:transcriptional regulator with XRE-family HTH domain
MVTLDSMIEDMNKAELLESLSLVIRDLRISMNLSQEELAERAGLHRTYISDIERGCRNLSVWNLHRIAAALGVNLSDIFVSVERRARTESHSKPK